MALSVDLRERVVGAVVEGGMSRNAAAKRFGVSIASAVRWVARFKAKGEISPAPTGGDRRSGRIEAHREHVLRQRINHFIEPLHHRIRMRPSEQACNATERA